MKYLKDLQKAQNKLVRFLHNSKISDKIRTSKMLSDLNMLSMNQMNAHIKIIEYWKAENIPNYPIKVNKKSISDESMNTRSITTGKLVESGMSDLVKESFIGDGEKTWNKIPATIKNSKTLSMAKNEVKKFVKTLPV